MGSVTATQGGTGPWQPVTSTTFLNGCSSIFGAGSFTSLASGSIAMGSILGQASTTGWVVSANGTQPTVTLGLDSSLRAPFATGTNSAVHQGIPGSQPFPVSGAPSSQQNAVTMNLDVQGTSVPKIEPDGFVRVAAAIAAALAVRKRPPGRCRGGRAGEQPIGPRPYHVTP